MYPLVTDEHVPGEEVHVTDRKLCFPPDTGGAVTDADAAPHRVVGSRIRPDCILHRNVSQPASAQLPLLRVGLLEHMAHGVGAIDLTPRIVAPVALLILHLRRRRGNPWGAAPMVVKLNLNATDPLAVCQCDHLVVNPLANVVDSFAVVMLSCRVWHGSPRCRY